MNYIAAETKVAQLYVAVLLDKYVSRLEVPVDNLLLVQILDAKQNIIHDCLNMDHVQPDVVLKYSSHITFDIVEDDVELSKA